VLFHSKLFLAFFPTVVLAFFLMPQRRRWIVLLAASYAFYMAWRPEYGLLLIASTAVDYFIAFRVHEAQERLRKKAWLGVSLAVNLGLLAYFKYSNFALEAFADILGPLGWSFQAPQLDILLPIGISFYTFQTLGYTLDIYWGRRAPERHFGLFALYVSFFPQLVAGPIERSTSLLPQFRQVQRFELQRVISGLSLMLLGFFKKLVIADRAADFVDLVYNHPHEQSGFSVLMGSYLFTIQIYCDFSAYSDIAIGAARVLGFDLMENFRRPYFARSIPDLWRRWHISLTTWLKDYLYTALASSKRSPWRTRRNMVIVFIAVGVWHGAAWTFVAFGAYHAALMVLSHMAMPRIARFKASWGIRGRRDRVWGLCAVVLTYHLWTISAVFFRGTSITASLEMLQRILTWSGPAGAWQQVLARLGGFEPGILLASIAALFTFEWMSKDIDSRDWAIVLPQTLRPALAACTVVAVLIFADLGKSPFYYFQF